MTARPPSTWYQLQKFTRRNRGLVAATFAIGVALLAGIAGTTYGLLRATKNADDANNQRIVAENKTDEAKRERANAVEAESRATAESQRSRQAEAAANFQLANARKLRIGHLKSGRQAFWESLRMTATNSWNSTPTRMEFCIKKQRVSNVTPCSSSRSLIAAETVTTY